jgi:UDP-N-acetylmuramoyl-tripeptide--D-alanyl-D-alanine ligase
MARAGRLLALLGEMRELGSLAEAAHRRTGAYARDVFDRVAVVDVGWGPALAEAAGGELVRDLAEGAEWVRREAQPGDVVLIKASHGVALDRVVDELLGAERAP